VAAGAEGAAVHAAVAPAVAELLPAVAAKTFSDRSPRLVSHQIRWGNSSAIGWDVLRRDGLAKEPTCSRTELRGLWRQDAQGTAYSDRSHRSGADRCRHQWKGIRKRGLPLPHSRVLGPGAGQRGFGTKFQTSSLGSRLGHGPDLLRIKHRPTGYGALSLRLKLDV